MIRISNIRAELTDGESELFARVRQKYGTDDTAEFKISKKSVDARRKNDVHYVCAVDVKCENEKRIVKRFKNVSYAECEKYEFPEHTKGGHAVIAGFGPAGMMCALTLAQNGIKPIVLERGKSVDERIKDVERFRNYGILDPDSNVQFGEGGAGTFSDGKLTTGINDKRIKKVLYEFYSHGAPEEILYMAKPHIGTDNLPRMVKNIRNDIIKMGGEIRFNTALTDIEIKNGKVTAAIINGNERIETDRIVLAAGHSARDVFEMLKKRNVKMEQKPFSVGVRIEHLQEIINRAQYGDAAKYLGAADYKLNVRTKSGRGVYTFCMCPGGEVIASASEEGGIVTNGMSRFARDKENANSALLVSVTPADYDDGDVLSGVRFQREIERRAYRAAGGNYSAICETVGHLYGGENKSDIKPTYMPGVVYGNISDALPDFVVSAIREALPMLDKKLNGFADKSAVMTAPETRSSSPVRVVRNRDTLMSNVYGLIPCGEGAGYAGGITSAAVDGIKAAEAAVRQSDS